MRARLGRERGGLGRGGGGEERGGATCCARVYVHCASKATTGGPHKVGVGSQRWPTDIVYIICTFRMYMYNSLL